MMLRRSQWFCLFLAILSLRLAIGYHFYHEGVVKLRSGDFSSAPFLRAATGPLAPWYHSLVDDLNGRIRLCVLPLNVDSDEPITIDTTQTVAIWRELFVKRAIQDYQFNQDQRKRARQLLENSEKQLHDLLQSNRSEILAWAQGEARLSGFERDGHYRQQTATQVSSLKKQVDTIRADRNRQADRWLKQVENIWDELETGINDIASADGSGHERITLVRPYRESNSPQALIDRWLPWFDVVVGGLLIIGLFTRPAAIAGMALLLGVVASQPPWVLGSADTFYQWVEISGLFVLAAISAGRFAGLDYFLGKKTGYESQGGRAANQIPASRDTNLVTAPVGR